MKKLFSTGSQLVLGAALLALTSVGLQAKAPKKVLVVTATAGFPHSSVTTAEKVLTRLGEESKAFTVVDVVRSGPRPSDKAAEAVWEAKMKADLAEKMSPEALKHYDGVIFANTTGDLPLPDNDAFIAWINSGKAFIGMHSATDTFHGYRPFIEMIGGEFLTHGPQVKVECLNQDPKHPATKEIGHSYIVLDEIYQLQNFHRNQVHGLLTLDRHPNNETPGDYPIAWCKHIGRGKMFYTSLGHREDVWESDTYQKHILGGIEWALGLERGDGKPQSTALKLSSAESKEGFKPLFNGVDFTGWKVRDTSVTNRWTVQNGMLINGPPDHGTDLVGEEKFWNFTVRYEYMVPTNSNSGVYLRGRDEIQIFDDYAAGNVAINGNGALYNIAAPAQFVSPKPGVWQTAEVTMTGNRVSVTLNGVKIHDNVLVERATPGGLDENVNEPGPFLLQGNHGVVAFRNLRVKRLK
jgi:type 1 glutamine amidotransferase